MKRGNKPGDGAGLSAGSAKSLRSRAERTAQNIITPSPEDTKGTVHELRVHQVELELQNEELRRVQDELDAERTRYFELCDLVPVGYCTVSEHGVILEVNLTAAHLLGVPRNALVKRPVARFVLKDDKNLYDAYLTRIFEPPSTDSPCPPEALKLRMVRTDGSTFWAHLKATVPHTDHGVPVCRLVLSDITVLATAEQAWRQTEQKYTRLYESIMDGFAISSLAGGYQKAADGSLTLYLQKDSPGKDKEANWLPAPEGVFWVVFRTYGPSPKITSQTWKLPPLERTK